MPPPSEREREDIEKRGPSPQQRRRREGDISSRFKKKKEGER